jgi:dimethylargininase
MGSSSSLRLRSREALVEDTPWRARDQRYDAGTMPVATRALTRAPSALLSDGELTHVTRRPIDLPRAEQQHRAYCERLVHHGLALVTLPALPASPDGVFVEDVLVVLDELAVLTRPGASRRRAEVASVEATLTSLQRDVRRIQAPATLDGGDVLQLARHVLVGRSTRTNDEALRQLAMLGGARPVLGIAVMGALHLKTAVTALPDGALIAAPAHVDVGQLERLGYTVHRALEASCANVLCLGDTVLLPADAPATTALLRGLGYRTESIDISELQKLEAGLTCMSALL